MLRIEYFDKNRFMKQVAASRGSVILHLDNGSTCDLKKDNEASAIFQTLDAPKTVRDQAVFTSHRIFMVDMQGVTGTRQEIFVLPYRKIVHFGIQTAGFGDPLQTSELTVCYADEHEMKFGFIGQEELLAVAQAISRCIL